LFNVLGILGACTPLAPLTVKSNTTWIEIPLSFLAAVCVLVVASDIFLNYTATNIITRSDGILLLLFFTVFLVYNVIVSRSDPSADTVVTHRYPTGKAILFLLLGLGGLVLGGRLIVESAVVIAQYLGLSQRVIGLTIVSIGTSLPELATSVVAVRRKNVD